MSEPNPEIKILFTITAQEPLKKYFENVFLSMVYCILKKVQKNIKVVSYAFEIKKNIFQTQFKNVFLKLANKYTGVENAEYFQYFF